MSLMLAVLVAWLFAMGTYLLLQRTLTRVIIGLGLMSHGAVMMLQVVGGRAGDPPLLAEGEPIDDSSAPLPQALGLTAIVISFAATCFLLTMAYRSWLGTGDDKVQDDIEDRRIAEQVANTEGHYQEESVPDGDEEMLR